MTLKVIILIIISYSHNYDLLCCNYDLLISTYYVIIMIAKACFSYSVLKMGLHIQYKEVKIKWMI